MVGDIKVVQWEMGTGNYFIELKGTGQGTANFTTIQPTDEGAVVNEFQNIQIISETKATINMSKEITASTLKVDSNSDGTVDFEIQPTSSEKVLYLRGDLDNNGKVNIFDLLELLKVLGGHTFSIAADVNGDEKYNIFDLLDLLRILGGSSR